MFPEVTPLLFSLLANLAAGAWIYSKRPDARVNRWFAYIVGLLCFWGFAEIQMLLASGPGQAGIWDRTTNLAGVLIPVAMTFFIANYIEEALQAPPRLLHMLGYAFVPVSAAFIPLIFFTRFISADMTVVGGKPVSVAGPGFPLFAAYVFAGAAFPACYCIVKGVMLRDSIQRRQAFVVGFSPVIPAAVFLVLEALPQTIGSTRAAGSYPFTVIFTLMLAAASRRLQIMTVTPGKSAEEMLDAQPDAVILVDRSGKIRHRNTACSARFGMDPAKGGTEDIRLVLALKTKGLEDLFDRPFDGIPSEISAAGEVRSASGAGIPVTVSFRKLSGPSSRARGAVLVLRDERPIRALEADLIHAEKIHSLAIMASGLAHELNNPLTAVIGYSEMGASAGSAGAGASHEFFETILLQARRAHGIVRKLLEFSGASVAADVPVSVNGIVSNVVDIRRYEIEVGRGHRVSAHLAPGLPLTVCDGMKIRQAFFNVFDNAFQAVEDSGRPGEIIVRTSEKDGTIAVSVQDTGPGIDPEIAPRIYDPFFTTRSPGKGTGLGLSIVKAHMDSLGGSVEYATAAGKGSVFTLRLPVVGSRAGDGRRPEPERGGKEPAVPHAPGILVFEEEQSVAGAISEALTAKGCSVEALGDLELFLERALAGSFDVLIFGVKAGDPRSAALLDRLRSLDAGLPGRTVLVGDFVSAEGTDGFRTIGRPVAVKDLIDSVVAVLADSRVSER